MTDVKRAIKTKVPYGFTGKGLKSIKERHFLFLKTLRTVAKHNTSYNF